MSWDTPDATDYGWNNLKCLKSLFFGEYCVMYQGCKRARLLQAQTRPEPKNTSSNSKSNLKPKSLPKNHES